MEGDGSKWDACCSHEMRSIFENRFMRKIIEILGSDAEAPEKWFEEMLSDMENSALFMSFKEKAKLGKRVGKKLIMTILMPSIRQTGGRPTSIGNWSTNWGGWTAILCVNPEHMVKKAKGKNAVPVWFRSAYEAEMGGLKTCSSDGVLYTNVKLEFYIMKYVFEGDDSLLALLQYISAEYEAWICRQWKSIGFNMKLKISRGSGFATFTGYQFLVTKSGLDKVYFPEITRAFTSCAWTCSSLALQNPDRAWEVGAASMLARAESWRHIGPICHFFAALSLAHIAEHRDLPLDDVTAKDLGIVPCSSVKQRALELCGSCPPVEIHHLALIERVTGVRFTEFVGKMYQFRPSSAVNCEDQVRTCVPDEFFGPKVRSSRTADSIMTLCPGLIMV